MKKLWMLLILLGSIALLISCGFFFDNDDPKDENGIEDTVPDNGTTEPDNGTTEPDNGTTENRKTVTLSSNVEGATFARSAEGLLTLDTQITVIAQDVAGYRFDHWIDLDTSVIVSIVGTYTFEVSKNHQLQAVYLAEGTYGIYLFSNIPEAILDQDGVGTYSTDATVNISVSAPESFVFLHWYDYYNDEILSTLPTLNHTVDRSRHLVAVYQYLDAVAVFYQTGFENATKGAYAAQSVDIDGQRLVLDDALIGISAEDNKFNTKSVRVRNNGSITSEFKVPFLYAVEFYHASYDTNPAATVYLEVSGDGETWILLTQATTSATLTELYFLIDSNFFETNSLDATSGLYMRIRKSGGDRVNIDNLKLYDQKVVTPILPQDRLDNTIIFPNNSTRLVMTIEHMIHHYSYGEAWMGATCTVLDIITELEKDCQRYGEVDTDALGEYTVVYYAIDDDGFTASQVFTKVVLRDASLLGFVYDDYYAGINELYGEALLLALRAIIQQNATLQTYDDARQILEIADRDPNNASNVLLIYNRASVQGLWDAETWHREHIWPNSRLGVDRVGGSQRNIASDLHNLRAINPSINSTRSNKLFGYEDTAMTHFPGEDRGDVARVYFYMVTMWDYLILGDAFPDAATTYEVEGAIHGLLSALIDFHYDDDVDAFEINRNNVIFSYQGNRNPFIDYPHLVELIWFDHQNIPLP